MKARALRDMSQEELRQKLAEIRDALFNLKFQHATGQLENTAQLGKYRRDVARLLTVLREREKA
ncbi:MAG: 50S ribosomal protein L29 [Thermodesulfobacteriota bacterium]|nr:50S ribosomal protein L29 [Thermodesulfobacteriota bacterium]